MGTILTGKIERISSRISIKQRLLKWMVAGQGRLHRLVSKATSIEERKEENHLVNCAKWLLIENLKMSEENAHRNIEKQAMDRCVNRREVVLNITKTYS